MSDYLVYIGTYTGPKSQGIYVYKLAAATGKLTPLGLAAEADQPVLPRDSILTTVTFTRSMKSPTYGGKKSGSVSAFSIDRTTGKLTLLNTVPSGDPGPCHVTVDHTGKYRAGGQLRSGQRGGLSDPP